MFSRYKSIVYPVEVDGKIVLKPLVDITTNIRIDPNVLNEIVYYNNITRANGETVEITSNENYQNPFLHYLIMLVNNDYDWRNNYPLTEQEFASYVNDKYVNPLAIHHYEDANGNVVDNVYYHENEQNLGTGPQKIIPITNIEYERSLIEKSRAIKIIKPEHIQLVRDIVKEKVDGTNL